MFFNLNCKHDIQHRFHIATLRIIFLDLPELLKGLPVLKSILASITGFFPLKWCLCIFLKMGPKNTVTFFPQHHLFFGPISDL